jgi:hypothetical protein
VVLWRQHVLTARQALVETQEELIKKTAEIKRLQAALAAAEAAQRISERALADTISAQMAPTRRARDCVSPPALGVDACAVQEKQPRQPNRWSSMYAVALRGVPMRWLTCAGRQASMTRENRILSQQVDELKHSNESLLTALTEARTYTPARQ